MSYLSAIRESIFDSELPAFQKAILSALIAAITLALSAAIIDTHLAFFAPYKATFAAAERSTHHHAVFSSYRTTIF